MGEKEHLFQLQVRHFGPANIHQLDWTLIDREPPKTSWLTVHTLLSINSYLLVSITDWK